MPSSSSSNLLPGPHDPYNASSVKLAEATRIRLVLPGLRVPDKDETATAKRTNAGDSSKSESSAALSKARKKLLKIQGIANQADKAHSSVIVDEGLLAAEAAAEEPADAVGPVGDGCSGSTGSSLPRCDATASRAEKCSSRHGASSCLPSTGAPASTSNVAGSTSATIASSTQQSKSKQVAFIGADGISSKFAGRLALPSPASAAATSAGDADSAGSTRSARTSRKAQQSDKPHVPIWERSLPQTPIEDKRPASSVPKLMQPVAIKTFSPTLGSLGSSLSSDPSAPPLEEASVVAVKSPVIKPRTAARTPAQQSDIAPGGAQPGRQQPDIAVRHPSSKRPSSFSDLTVLSTTTRSQSFTGACQNYQRPSVLFEKLTLGGT